MPSIKKRDWLAELEQLIPAEQLLSSQALEPFYPRLDDTHSQVGSVLEINNLDNLSGPDLIAQLSSLQRYNAGRAALLNCVITIIQRHAAVDDKQRRQIFLSSCKINNLNATRFRRGLLVACQLLMQRDSVKESKSWLKRYARKGFFPWSAVYSQTEARLADSTLCDQWMTSAWEYYSQARAAGPGLHDVTIPVKKWKFPTTEEETEEEEEDEEEEGEGEEDEDEEDEEEEEEEDEGEGEEGEGEDEDEEDDDEELEEGGKVLGKRQRKATTIYSPGFDSPEKGSAKKKKKRDVRVKQEGELADFEIQALKEENEGLTEEVKTLKKQLRVAKKMVAKLKKISVKEVEFVVID